MFLKQKINSFCFKNKYKQFLFSKQKSIGLFLQFYKNVFSKTKMHLNSGLGLGTGKIIPCLSPSNCGEPINLFLLPEFDAETGIDM